LKLKIELFLLGASTYDGTVVLIFMKKYRSSRGQSIGGRRAIHWAHDIFGFDI
jgi:hypothetical protein